MDALMKPWIVVPLLLALLAAAQIWLSHLRYELSLEAQRSDTQKQELTGEVSKLRIELASLTRPERLRKIAQQQLGMGPPKPSQVVNP